MKGSPCKDCEYRHLRCHATCEPYKEFAAERQRYNEDRHKKSEIAGYVKQAHLKTMKGR